MHKRFSLNSRLIIKIYKAHKIEVKDSKPVCSSEYYIIKLKKRKNFCDFCGLKSFSKVSHCLKHLQFIIIINIGGDS